MWCSYRQHESTTEPLFAAEPGLVKHKHPLFLSYTDVLQGCTQLLPCYKKGKSFFFKLHDQDWKQGLNCTSNQFQNCPRHYGDGEEDQVSNPMLN